MRVLKTIFVAVCLLGSLSISCFATQTKENRYYIGSAVNAGKDTGFSKNKEIKDGDPHFGWTLGEFYISGYTSLAQDENGNPIFLKTVGDEIALFFCLQQNIEELNGKSSLIIYKDKNGYDQYFGIPKTSFGRGALVIKHIDSENHASDPIIYTDFLAANVSENADVMVKLLEEGDYEVALNYEIRKKTKNIFDKYKYYNYRIFFRFSVRNGNCIVFPFDVATKSELGNTAFTENGFYIDFANTEYLDVYIKKEVLTEGATGLTEDTRYNRPVKDGECFTEEGVYTITATNKYTLQTTVKKLYVGNNPVGKAYVTTGMSLEEINMHLSNGAEIVDDGSLLFPVNDAKSDGGKKELYGFYLVIPFVLVGTVVLSLWLIKKKRRNISE